MKGSNRIVLNVATLKEALEYWLTHKFLKSEESYKVESIEMEPYDNQIHIYIEPEEDNNVNR